MKIIDVKVTHFYLENEIESIKAPRFIIIVNENNVAVEFREIVKHHLANALFISQNEIRKRLGKNTDICNR